MDTYVYMYVSRVGRAGYMDGDSKAVLVVTQCVCVYVCGGVCRSKPVTQDKAICM